MAFKVQEKKKMPVGMIVAGVCLAVMLIGMGVYATVHKQQAIQEQEQTQEIEQTEEEVKTENVNELTSAQADAKMSETTESKEFWTLITGSKWNDTTTGSVLEFNQEKAYLKEEIAKSNNKHVTTFVVCKLTKKNNSLGNGESESAYSATCMNGDNKLFDVSLVVTKLQTGDIEKVSNMVITSDGFTLGSYYTRIVSSENFQVTGLNKDKLQAFGVDEETLTRNVKEYCVTNLPSITKLDFSNAKITGFMSQNYVIFSVVPSGVSSVSSKTIYIMYMADTGEVQVSEINTTATSGY